MLRNGGAGETVQVIEAQLHAPGRDRLRISIGQRRADAAAGDFADQLRGALQRPEGLVRIGAPLEAERGVGLQAVLLRRLPHAARREVGALEELVESFR